MSKNRGKELWKNDKEFNELLAKRQHLSKDSNDYKTVTKAVKRRIIFLKNQKLRKEADEINENATRRQVAELYTNMKDCNTIFKKLHEKQGCDPQMLKEYFETHFNKTCENVEQTDLIDAPIVIRSLCDVTDTDINTAPPCAEELKSTIRSLKNGKSPAAYIKHAIECSEFTNEMV